MKTFFRRCIAVVLEWQVRRLIHRHKPLVVAVAGSVGKTGTKLAIATVLSQKYQTLVHEGNYNSELGLPLSIFQLEVPRVLWNPFAWLWRYARAEAKIWGKYPYRALVLELGTDQPGEISRYLHYLKPDIGVITAVTPEHMANFPGGLEQVAQEELALVRGTKVVLVNRDQVAANFRHKFVDPHPKHHYYGEDDGSDFRLKVKSSDPLRGTVLSFSQEGQVAFKDLQLDIFGLHSAKAALAAYATAKLLGLTQHQTQAGLAKLRPNAGRMNVLPGKNGSVIIDDTYNSSPDAVTAALQALAAAPVSGRRIAILGSMNELGDASPVYHEEVGSSAAGVDLLMTVGELANRYLGPAAVRAGLDPTRFRPADNPYAAAEFLAAMLQPGDLVLAKGSQNRIFVEEAVKLLLADPKDRAKLVRQSPAWQKTKRSQFPEAYVR